MKFLFLFLIFWPSASFAYLDPGTGSMILQAVIAAVVGGGYAIKVYWLNLKKFFESKLRILTKNKSKSDE